jgi:tetratricopeptide (TPR) repeat protein
MRNAIVMALLCGCWLLPQRLLAQSSATEPQREAWVGAAMLHVADDWRELAKLPVLTGEAQPQRDASGQVLLGAVVLVMIEPGEAAERGGVSGALDVANGRLFVFVAGDDDGRGCWRGPRELQLFQRDEVIRELERHKSDSGQQGFFDGRYARLQQRFGPPVVPHLVAIVNESRDPQVQQLALEALGQLGYRSALEPLKALHGNPRLQQRYGVMLVVALARLGSRNEFDELVGRWSELAKDERREGQIRAQARSSIALLYSQLGQHDTALEHYFAATELDPTNALAYYNLGCTYALLGRADEAFAALGRAIDNGYDQFEWMRMDGDLLSLRKDPRWKPLLARQFAKQATPDEQRPSEAR